MSDKQTTLPDRDARRWRQMGNQIRFWQKKWKRAHQPLVLMLARKWIRRI